MPICDYVPDWGQHPVCSHHRAEGTDERVRAALFYAAGLAASEMPIGVLFDRIARLHDHKGWLHVLVWKPLGPRVERCLREAWRDIAVENEDAVSFHQPDDPNDWVKDWWPEPRGTVETG